MGPAENGDGEKKFLHGGDRGLGRGRFGVVGMGSTPLPGPARVTSFNFQSHMNKNFTPLSEYSRQKAMIYVLKEKHQFSPVATCCPRSVCQREERCAVRPQRGRVAAWKGAARPHSIPGCSLLLHRHSTVVIFAMRGRGEVTLVLGGTSPLLLASAGYRLSLRHYLVNRAAVAG